MRTTRLGRLLIAALVVGTTAFAQTEPAGRPLPPPNSGLGEEEAIVSPEVMKQQAAKIIARIDTVDDLVVTMWQAAKQDGNVVRWLCLTDKSNQVGLALGTAKDRQTSMLAALARNSQRRARHEYRLLLVLGESVELLSAEANQCLGGEAGLVGESSLTVQVDPNLPEADPDVIPIAPIVVIVPLVASSTD